MAYLIDTNIVSEILRRRPDPNVVTWWQGTTAPFFLSVLVIGDLVRGIERVRHKDPTRAALLEDRVHGITQSYDDRTLPVTATIALTWGRLGAVRPLPEVDGLLAATAIVHGLTLVTRNLKDFEGLDVPLVNPFGS